MRNTDRAFSFIMVPRYSLFTWVGLAMSFVKRRYSLAWGAFMPRCPPSFSIGVGINRFFGFFCKKPSLGPFSPLVVFIRKAFPEKVKIKKGISIFMIGKPFIGRSLLYMVKCYEAKC
ncbi:hypothetical protein ACD591_06260 [Rufibacter glacialis]|uniref:Uncharacterized protein n=1 Tax=Rufibacter glacialis TaxID=1259555 RepID=A0A5M8QFR2_9BACT|nr:hypothetical protein [Rufibacter glacialis]KAA6433262.1 hypothetical protein FOE74_12310 [Rufibacter glacialis]